ncbi:hypothetical protein [Pseudorhodobacter wandonensis]|uniref:hypothetical protein n=1 Tax=Pseudorhodobacter wandonensis TaxID=1120568 RepID=UPI00067BEFAD|nr:hypothetical protein [Pseudorhodobacter wandonensis]
MPARNHIHPNRRSAWLAALAFAKDRLPFGPTLALAFTALWAAPHVIAPAFGRTALPCWGDDPLRRIWPPRHHTQTSDAGFPIGTMPLLPHLSHDDGESQIWRCTGRQRVNTKRGKAYPPSAIGAMPTARANARTAGPICAGI